MSSWPHGRGDCQSLEYYDRAMDMCLPCENICLRGPQAAAQCRRQCPGKLIETETNDQSYFSCRVLHSATGSLFDDVIDLELKHIIQYTLF